VSVEEVIDYVKKKFQSRCHARALITSLSYLMWPATLAIASNMPRRTGSYRSTKRWVWR